jgi:hypothetical protein
MARPARGTGTPARLPDGASLYVANHPCRTEHACPYSLVMRDRRRGFASLERQANFDAVTDHARRCSKIEVPFPWDQIATDLLILGVNLVYRPIVQALVFWLGTQPQPAIQMVFHLLPPSPRAPCRLIARRPHEKRDVGLRDGETGRIDRRGERRFDQPPHEPSAEFWPLKAQRRLQARLEKSLALRWVEPRPALHRGLEQITRHLATLSTWRR